MSRPFFCVLMTAGLSGLLAPNVHGQPPQGRPPAPVWVAPVSQNSYAGSMTVVGTFVPSNVAVLGSAADGRVSEFPVEAGDRVQTMQPVAQLLTTTIELEHAAAAAELKLREAELAELKNGARDEEKEQAQAALDAAEARKVYFELRRKRLEALANRTNAVSAEEFEEAVSHFEEAKQIYLQRKAELTLVLAGPRAEDIDQAQARVDIQAANVERLADQMAKYTVKSRLEGYVTAEFTEVGQWLKRGDPVVEISALDEVDLEVYVVEQQIPFIELGTEVEVEIGALRRSFPGKVRAVIPKADVKTRTFPVMIRVKNEVIEGVPVIKAGMLATVELPVRAETASLLVPKDAVVLGGQSPVVFRVTADQEGGESGTVSPVPVKLGTPLSTWIEIEGNLSVGDWVVVRGNERLRPDQAVRITQRDSKLNISESLKPETEVRSGQDSPEPQSDQQNGP